VCSKQSAVKESACKIAGVDRWAHAPIEFAQSIEELLKPIDSSFQSICDDGRMPHVTEVPAIRGMIQHFINEENRLMCNKTNYRMN
jgi:hypothetical protein